MPEVTMLGAEFAHALAEKDSNRLRELFAPQIDFQALTPRRTWEASDPETVLSIVFGHWFEDSDDIEALEELDTDSFADRQRVRYRFSVDNPEGHFLRAAGIPLRAQRPDHMDAGALLGLSPGPIWTVATHANKSSSTCSAAD